MHTAYFLGGDALSGFARDKAVAAAARRGAAKPRAFRALNLYAVACDSQGALEGESGKKLARLLGARLVEPERLFALGAVPGAAARFAIAPRFGTVSPWASKATDIARNSGLKGIERIERLTWHEIVPANGAEGGSAGAPDSALAEAWANALLDPMTQSAALCAADLAAVFAKRPQGELKCIPVSQQGARALKDADKALGLALSDKDVDYLLDVFGRLGRDPTDVELMMFSQVNSEHCRHKIFNADFEIDGQSMPSTLFAMIKRTHSGSPDGTVVAYKDNSSVIEGAEREMLRPGPEGGAEAYVRENANILMKVETHNHPTAIASFPGAATGSGGEIRDEGATGRGGKPKAGLCGFAVNDLRIPGKLKPWEEADGPEGAKIPPKLESALQIMIDGPLGAASFNNEFGRPCLTGFFRTFTAFARGRRWGYCKPIMAAGGMGSIVAGQSFKGRMRPGDALLQLGGPGYLIGLGGGAASSMGSGDNDEKLDFASVQRGNPEMQRRCQEVIDACWAMGEDNPIVSIHDVGAGGLSNAFPELVRDGGLGARFDLSKAPIDEPGMSPMEIWCNESQERYVVAVRPENVGKLEALCARERCPIAQVGVAIAEPRLIVSLGAGRALAVDMPMDDLFGASSKIKKIDTVEPVSIEPYANVDRSGESLGEAAERVLSYPAVASKAFLVTIGDRTVGGLTVKDQMVGRFQLPIADRSVTRSDFLSDEGEAMSMGERPPVAVCDAAASARLAVAEALTNIAPTRIAKLGNVKLSANWMAAAGEKGEASNLYNAVSACSALCREIGVSIPVGKDSLSMTGEWVDPEDGRKRKAFSPVSLVVSAFAPVADVKLCVDPDLKHVEGSCLALIDLSQFKGRMGMSSYCQTLRKFDGVPPDVDNPHFLIGFFDAIQKLVASRKLLAYHDRSDGGLLACVCEMAFASRMGVRLDLTELASRTRQGQGMSSQGLPRPAPNGSGLGAESAGDGSPIPGASDGEIAKRMLFNEEIGAVLQIREGDFAFLQDVLESFSMGNCLCRIGTIDLSSERLEVAAEGETLMSEPLGKLRRAWQSVSLDIQTERDDPGCAREEFGMADKPGEAASLRMDPGFDCSGLDAAARRGAAMAGSERAARKLAEQGAEPVSAAAVSLRPKVAILREQGVNSHVEAANAFALAGFEPHDVHMTDLLTGARKLEDFSVLVACGGFSYGDVLGAGGGWAACAMGNPALSEMFERFFARKDTLSLGICNGCQMLRRLKGSIPGAEDWPDFVPNRSGRFEARLVNVKVLKTDNVFLDGMAGAILPIVVSHGEGRARFGAGCDPSLPLSDPANAAAKRVAALQYVDGEGNAAETYPLNPNGSDFAVAGVTGLTGRNLIMMPHPERSAHLSQLSWFPDDWAGEMSPWFRLFLNARKFFG